MRQTEVRTVAFHEAGHALAAHFLQMDFDHVTIEPDEGSLGHVLHPPYGESGMSFVELTRDERERVENSIIVSLAGPEAERLSTGRYNRQGARSDMEQVTDLVQRMPYSEKGQRLFLRWLKDRAYCMVREPMHQIILTSIVEELVRSRRLTAEQVRNIVTSSSENLRLQA